MNSNRQIFLDNHPTSTAYLRGVGRVHGDQLATSFFHFVCQQLPEFPQPCVMRREGEMSVPGHELEVEVFNRDQRVRTRQFPGQFVPVVVTLVSHLLMQSGDLPDRLVPTLAALPASGYPALGDPQLSKRLTQPAQVAVKLTIAGGKQGFQPHVDADCIPNRNGSILCFGDVQHQAGVPFVVDPLDDYMLDRRAFGDRSVVDDLHFTDILDVEAYLTVVFRTQLAPVPIAVLDRLETVAPLEARETGCLACPQSAEEGREGFIQPAEHLLDAGGVQHPELIGVVVALIAEVRPLSRVVDALAGFLIDGNTLLKGGIVQVARLPEQVVKLVSLLFIWAKSVLVGVHHRTIVLNSNPDVKRVIILLDRSMACAISKFPCA